MMVLMLHRRAARTQSALRAAHRRPLWTSSTSSTAYAASSGTAPATSPETASSESQGPREPRSKPLTISERHQVLAALRCFRAAHGHALVPPRFVVPSSSAAAGDHGPWPAELQGVAVGALLQRLYRHLDPPTSEALRALGCPVDVADWRFVHWRETYVAALRAFRGLHGHPYVPRTFCVPTPGLDDNAVDDDGASSSWPRATWGLPLGMQTHVLRRRGAERLPARDRAALEAVDFAWDVMEHRWRRQVLPALERFHQLHGHVDIPQRFVVPRGDADRRWLDLPAAWGYALGAAVNRIRRGDAFTAQVVCYWDELLDLGFTLNSFDRSWCERVRPGLEAFAAIHGHCHVPVSFIVPDRDPQWPRATWGMRLGFIVQNIRTRGDFFPQLMRDGRRLEALGFVWHRAEVKWQRRVLPALEAFAAIHGHVAIPGSFVVPHGAPWPEASFGLRLGRLATQPRARDKYANYIEIDRPRLEAIGLRWSVFGEDGDKVDEEEEEEEEDDDDDPEGGGIDV